MTHTVTPIDYQRNVGKYRRLTKRIKIYVLKTNVMYYLTFLDIKNAQKPKIVLTS